MNKEHNKRVLNKTLRYETTSLIEQTEDFLKMLHSRRLGRIESALNDAEMKDESKVFALAEQLEHLKGSVDLLEKNLQEYVKNYRACMQLINAQEFYKNNPEKLEE